MHATKLGKAVNFGFLKLSRSPEVDELMRYPAAFMLLTQVARRARRTADGFNPDGLGIGEALVGDYRSIGASEQRYRTSKAQLEKWGFATFRATNKGTVARLLNTRVFDINPDSGNERGNEPCNVPPNVPPNVPSTTNEEVKKGRSRCASRTEEGTRPSAAIPAGYDASEREIIELWHEVAVSAGLGFLPVDQCTDAVRDALLHFPDAVESRALFEFAVRKEREKPSRRSKTLVRVLNDAAMGGYFGGETDEEIEEPF